MIAKCHSKPGTPCFLYPLRFIVDTLAHFLSNTAKNTDKILKRNCCVAFSSSGVEQILPHHYTENWLGRQSPFWAAGTRRLVGDKGNSDGGVVWQIHSNVRRNVPLHKSADNAGVTKKKKKSLSIREWSSQSLDLNLWSQWRSQFSEVLHPSVRENRTNAQTQVGKAEKDKGGSAYFLLLIWL